MRQQIVNLILLLYFFRNWKFEHPQGKEMAKFSIRYAKFGNNSLFSREIAYSILLTNVLTFIFGVGIGWVLIEILSNQQIFLIFFKFIMFLELGSQNEDSSSPVLQLSKLLSWFTINIWLVSDTEINQSSGIETKIQIGMQLIFT